MFHFQEDKQDRDSTINTCVQSCVEGVDKGGVRGLGGINRITMHCSCAWNSEKK